MSRRTTVNDFTGEVTRICEVWTDEIVKEVNEAVESVGRKTAEDLKVAGGFEDRTGKYRRGWTVDIQKNRFGVTATVHNKEYQLTHLLEFGHAKQNGGRTRAFPHIANAEEEAKKMLEEEIRKAVEK